MNIGVQVRRLALVALAVMASACHMKKSTTKPEERWVQVDNQNYADMNVYVVQGGRRQRLGMVTGNSKATLALPRALSHGFQTLRFVMDPVGGSRQSYTQDLTVQPGQNILLTIRP